MPFSQEEWDRYLKDSNNRHTPIAPRTDFLAQNITFRTSCPNAAATVAVFFDGTGSMAELPALFAKGPLTTLVQQIATRGTLPSTEIMTGIVGDALAGDRHPLQATEFSTSVRAAKQLRQLFAEGGGGSNGHEDYQLAWQFAANKTDPICLQYGKKGILFTIGDDYFPGSTPVATLEHYCKKSAYAVQSLVETNSLALTSPSGSSSAAPTTTVLEIANSVSTALTNPVSTALANHTAPPSMTTLMQSRTAARRRIRLDQLSTALGSERERLNPEREYVTTSEILAEVRKKYHVFHIVVGGDHNSELLKKWRELLGDNAIPLNRNATDNLAELMVSIIERFFGCKPIEQIALTWQQPRTQQVIRDSLANLGTLAIVPYAPQAIAPFLSSTMQPTNPLHNFLQQNGFNPTNINARNNTGHTPLTLATLQLNTALVKEILKQSSVNINERLRNGDTALHFAIRGMATNLNYRSLAILLIQYGANVNQKNEQQISPSMIAGVLQINNIHGLPPQTTQIICPPEVDNPPSVIEECCNWRLPVLSCCLS